MARELCEALADEGALAAAARRVIGRGPGLTPSGDDVLVGLLTALGMRQIGLRERLARALAPALPTTTSLSRHLIEEAALGLPGRALHELGTALLSGVNLAAASERALAIGATSGADAAVGLIAGCRHVYVIPAQAGIQGIETRGSTASPKRKLWIPACAGMTGESFVIPAEAGIQGIETRGSAASPRRTLWIPASAGMTEGAACAGMTEGLACAGMTEARRVVP